MITVSQIREHLLNFLAASAVEQRRSALDEFEEWFSRASWNMHQNSDLLAQRFAAAIELRLAEYDAEQLSEDELRSQIRDLVREFSLHISEQPVIVTSSSSIDFNFQVWAFSASGRKLVTAS
jgi:hypothetical protein